MAERSRSAMRVVTDQVLPVLALVGILVALYMVFMYAPTDRDQGVVQRIFYFHVPSAFMTFAAVGVMALGSAMFLWRGGMAWDRLAHAGAEVGVVFCTIVLTTGPIWARPIWGTWWTWDARLTTTLVLWLIYVGYLMLRSFAPSAEQGARYAAILGIVAAIDVPIINRSVYWWRTIHPAVLVNKGGGSGLMDPRMRLTFLVCVLAFAALFAWLLWLRYQSGRLRDSVDALRLRALEA